MSRKRQRRRETEEPTSWEDAIAAAEEEIERLLLSADLCAWRSGCSSICGMPELGGLSLRAGYGKRRPEIYFADSTGLIPSVRILL